jgi:predicted branched-subunit amino acid permease
VEGLEFALCALFVTLTLDAAKTRNQVPSLHLAALSIGTALLAAPGASLFAGLVIFLVLLIGRFAMERRRGVLDA